MESSQSHKKKEEETKTPLKKGEIMENVLMSVLLGMCFTLGGFFLLAVLAYIMSDIFHGINDTFASIKWFLGELLYVAVSIALFREKCYWPILFGMVMLVAVLFIKVIAEYISDAITFHKRRKE